METPFSILIGKTITKIQGLKEGSEKVTFTCSDGERFYMSHSQDCCEHVRLIDIEGDIDDLLGVPIVQAEVSTNSDNPPEERMDTCFTWTFYKLAGRGHVTLRWLGESNGYYSEEVDFARLVPIQD
jgi:hypothetical protein